MYFIFVLFIYVCLPRVPPPPPPLVLLGAAVGHVFITDDTASREMTAALRFCSCTFENETEGVYGEAVNQTEDERPQ